MKDRTREAIFNLISTVSEGRHVIDLFAGTGALGLEALSRGAAGATFIEQHLPTAKILEQNIAALGVSDQSRLLITSAFLWGRRDLPRVTDDAEPRGATSAIAHTPLEGAVPPTTMPWLVFCSPPYAFYGERWFEMRGLIEAIRIVMPASSALVIEAHEAFDFSTLDASLNGGAVKESGWRLRSYPPAVIGILGP